MALDAKRNLIKIFIWNGLSYATILNYSASAWVANITVNFLIFWLSDTDQLCLFLLTPPQMVHLKPSIHSLVA